MRCECHVDRAGPPAIIWDEGALHVVVRRAVSRVDAALRQRRRGRTIFAHGGEAERHSPCRELVGQLTPSTTRRAIGQVLEVDHLGS